MHCASDACQQGKRECPTPTACGAIVNVAQPPKARDHGISGPYRKTVRSNPLRALVICLGIAAAVCIAGAVAQHFNLF